MSSRPHIVYLTFDGLLEPLGYAQVARVVKGLAGTGRYQMTVCSLEKPEDRVEGDREGALANTLQKQGIGWRRAEWSGGGGPLDVARNVRSMGALLSGVCSAEKVDLIHARSYVAASVARHVGGARQIPYLFDIRGYWVDERIEQGRWFMGPIRRRAARKWEQALYKDAAGVVSLTELAAQDIREQRLGPWKAQRPLSVIPTCVDYGEFGLGGPGNAEGVSEGLAKRLQASLVVGFVGAVEQAYCVEESLRLFDHILARRPDAHLLCLTRNPPALLMRIEKMGLPPSTYTVKTATHEEMSSWLQWMDWGLLLRRDGPSHRAAMPTKLAEFFASGVRPIQWGGNEEVRQWVERAGSGHVLERLDEAALRRAADVIATQSRSLKTVLGARWRTRTHFDLRQGIERYGRIYEEILAREVPKLKVLFLTEGTTVPASRYRVEQLVPHLEERGVECTVRAAYGDGYNRWAPRAVGPVYKLMCSLQRLPFAADADRFDVVFLQRPALPFSALAERMANWRNPRTIFDVDDAIFLGPDGKDDLRQRRTFEEIVGCCAHVICGNEYLAQKTKDITPTTVIPTVIDTERYRPGPGKNDGQTVTIGWMGTATNFVSLELVAPLLRRLLGEYEELRVQIVANQIFEPLSGVEGVEQIPWEADEEIWRLQQFDIGIMPLLDNASTRGKCGFKAIQYMSVAVPVVASAVGANKTILAGGEAGILAEDEVAFEKGLRRLIEDGRRRQIMGRAGRQRVEERYSIDAVIDSYIHLLRMVADKKTVEEEVFYQDRHRPLLTS